MVLGSRAADILIFLAAHAGDLKTNAEIVRHVWPDTFVEEANLRVHISALRKALDDIQKEPKAIASCHRARQACRHRSRRGGQRPSDYRRKCAVAALRGDDTHTGRCRDAPADMTPVRGQAKALCIDLRRLTRVVAWLASISC
ncbi:hypothetical protein GR138_10430 [Shinella kummerowiae]|uniref:OmpR/PhoB-type domain-containing protein n=1 Tax=Shinella kummerowiae TaxID=417745 RepID=A0A6N8SAB3_9HYPH|nr:hypothetical protein [Shinella kummerowiae]